MSLVQLLLVVLAVVATGTAQEDAPLARAEDALRAGKLETALAAFDRILSAAPGCAAAHAGGGRCLLRMGRVADAIQRLESAERRFPDSADVLATLGETYYADARRQIDARPRGPAAEIKFRLIDAADRLERATRVNPRHHRAFYILGLARLFLDPPEARAAVAALEAARPAKAEDPEYHFFLGLAREKAGSLLAAADAFRTAAERYQAEKATLGFALTAWKRAGACAAGGGKDAAALRAFSAAVALDPRRADTFQEIWNAYAGDPQRLARGAELLSRLRRDRPGDALPLYYLGFVEEARGDRAAARRAFEAVLKTREGRDFPEAWCKVGNYLLADAGREDAAAEHAEQALRLDAAHAGAYRLLQSMVSRHVAGRSLVRAEALTRTILRYRPDDGLEWANLGLFLRDQKRYRESCLAYRNAVRLAPHRAQVLNDAAVVLHYHLRRRAEAEKLYRRAVDLDPETVDALENLGALAFDRGALDEAEAWFRKVLGLQPGRRKALHYLDRIAQARKAKDPR